MAGRREGAQDFRNLRFARGEALQEHIIQPSPVRNAIEIDRCSKISNGASGAWMKEVTDFHRPVMCEELIEYLAPRPGNLILDCTVGTGGHSEAILRKVLPGGRLIGLDRDGEALEVAKDRLKEFDGSYTLIHDNFQNLTAILDRLNVEKVDGIVFDVGVSSFQLDTPQRGFSIRLEAPLDMRMDRAGQRVSASDLANNLAEREIARLLELYGQERWSRRIARSLVKKRREGPIVTTTHLAEIVRRAIPYKGRHGRIHPATRTFQAFRIAVNRELESLEVGLKDAVSYLAPGARICVISFQSLEDRIVKNLFRSESREGTLRIVTKRPLTPSTEEILVNPRARSAKMRAAEKIKNS